MKINVGCLMQPLQYFVLLLWAALASSLLFKLILASLKQLNTWPHCLLASLPNKTLYFLFKNLFNLDPNLVGIRTGSLLFGTILGHVAHIQQDQQCRPGETQSHISRIPVAYQSLISRISVAYSKNAGFVHAIRRPAAGSGWPALAF